MSLHTLMFGWEYPPAHCGGLGVACQGIVRGLLHHGAQVTLVLPHDEGVEDGVKVLYPTEKGEMVVKVPSILKPYDTHTSFTSRLTTLHAHGIDQLYGANLGDEVERFTSMSITMTKDTNPDIVHAHDWMTFEAARRSAEYHKRPFVAHIHATELDRTEFNPHPWIFEKELEGLLAADHIITVSHYTKQLLIREYGIREDKVTVLHNGTADTPASTSFAMHHKRHPLVLFLGRLTVQKGATYFLKAAQVVTKAMPASRFVIAGDGYLLPELINDSIEMNLADHVMFAGKVSSDEAMKLYQKASCFVMPSVSEPFGLVALEAITHGAPVILSKQSGASEVVHNALTVDFWDTDKMADCILTVLREEPLQKEMRSHSPAILKKLTWNNQAGKMMDLYRRILG